MSVCVFLGPTLAVTHAVDHLDATFLPPVKAGDVYSAVNRYRPRAIGIVDGYFQWVPAVRHKEILWAMAQGVDVFGAASMGALRAAELASFGMHGVGRIFEAYRSGHLTDVDDDPFEDDDEVAVVHGPPESGYRRASEAMVDIRCTLARAADEGLIAEPTRCALAKAAKAAFFPGRGYVPLLAQGRAAGLPGHELDALEGWLPSGRVDQKRRDALAMLEAMREFLADDPAPRQVTFTLERTTHWENAEAAFRAIAEPGAATVLAALRLDAAGAERLDENELRDWYFARVAGTSVPEDLFAWIRDSGYADEDEFHREAFAHYLRSSIGSGGHP